MRKKKTEGWMEYWSREKKKCFARDRSWVDVWALSLTNVRSKSQDFRIFLMLPKDS